MLSLAGWNDERLAGFTDDQPLTAAERSDLIELLWRVRSFAAESVDLWTRTSELSVKDLLDEPATHRGAMLGLAGRVVAIEQHELSPRDAARLESPAYYACRIELADGAGVATVITPQVPRDWPRGGALDEPVSASALFVKRIGGAAASGAAASAPAALLIAKRIAWRPTLSDSARVSAGKALLGTLGMDVGLLDDVQSRGKIRAAEREAFYQLLRSAGSIGANQLVRSAQSTLATTRDRWMRELERAQDDANRALAREVIRRAEEGRYSVAPLFNQPERHAGELVMFDGVARRAVRVDVGTRPDGRGPSDVARRFGIHDYYELVVFTDDSQNYPLVFCLRALPAGFPTGGDVDVRVRVAGFFFKDWLYTTRGTSGDDARDNEDAVSRSQFAPLIIGPAPLVLQVEPAGNEAVEWIFGGLFVLALLGIWAVAWWSARGDRQFAARARGAELSLSGGESLNDLNVPAAEEPIKYAGGAAPGTSGTS
jgi:hypothetical protein